VRTFCRDKLFMLIPIFLKVKVVTASGIQSVKTTANMFLTIG
jgi:hypothetical protein